MGTLSNELLLAFLINSTASAASKPESEAEIIWSAPLATVASPGVTSMRYGAAASTSLVITKIADNVWRK